MQEMKSISASTPEVVEELDSEQLARNFAFFGQEKMQKLFDATVVVVGLGGVGSHATAMLVRSGCRNVRIVDFDQVTLSSLNRHALAVQADVGSSKVVVAKRRLAEISPWCKVEAINEKFCKENAEIILKGADFVLDCIDNLETKVALIEYCVKQGLKIVSSMGAGARIDPSKIQIADVSETTEDPLSRAVRLKLRRLGIMNGVPVVYSSEKASVDLLPLPDVVDPREYSVLPNFRVRILPVFGAIPAMFGCAMAAFAVASITGWPMDPLPIKNRKRFYFKIMAELSSREKHNLSVNQIGLLVDDLWKSKSALSGSTEKLMLVRLNPFEEVSMENLVLISGNDEEQLKDKRDQLEKRIQQFFASS